MSIDPKILARMRDEGDFLQSQTHGSRRVKLERGQNWIVRFLPARMGPDGLWFARIARHWLHKLPIVCPRNTAVDFGGDPECECPACLVAEELNDSGDEAISKFGFKSRSSPQYLTYCAVFEKDGTAQSISEVLNPYEFWHYRSTYEELKGFYIAGGRKCADSVLDYKFGNDFSVNRTGKGLRLDKLDSAPIFDEDEARFEEYIKKIESAMKTPKVVIPTMSELNIFANKMQAAADRGTVDDDDDDRSRGRRRRSDYDEDEPRRRDNGNFRRNRYEEEDEPRHPRHTSRSSRDEDDLPYDDEPPRASRRPAPVEEEAPARNAARRPAPVEEEAPRRRAPGPVENDATPPRRRPVESDDEPATRQRSTETASRRHQEDRETAETQEPPRTNRPAPKPVSRKNSEPEPEPEPETGAEPEPEETPAQVNRRRTEPTARRSQAPKPTSTVDDDDPLPDDDKDSVPPASNDDAPPPVTRRGGQGSAIRERISRMKNDD